MKNLHDVQRVLNLVRCPPFVFQACEIGNGFGVQAYLWRRDTDTGEWGWGEGGWHYFPANTSDSNVAKRCFVAARDYAEHEVREAFEFDGQQVLGPHIDLYDLRDLLEG